MTTDNPQPYRAVSEAAADWWRFELGAFPMHDSDVLDRFETELADVIEDILNRHGHAELFTDAYCEPCFDLVIAATHVGLSTETSAPDGFVQWPSSKSMTIEPGEIRVKCGYFGQYSTFWTA